MPAIFWGATTLIFAALASYFAFRFERKIKQSQDQEREIRRKIYELNLLSEITEKIGYSLKIESIAETIALSVQTLFDLSTVSYSLKTDDKSIRIKTFAKEPVNPSYTKAVLRIIFDSMVAIEPALASYKIEELPIQPFADEALETSPQSYFNVPLVINNNLVGMINISSRKKGIYQDEDMSLIYKIVNKAEGTITKLESVIETEEVKLDRLISTLPSGAIMFSAEDSGFSLSVINQSAKDFLNLKENADMAQVLSRFGGEIDISQKIQNAFRTKRNITINDAKIYDKYFTIYINPVLLESTDKLIGVAIILLDMSLEKKIEKIREDFTNMLLHELRTPLGAIKGASSLLLSGNLSENEKRKMPKIILDTTNNMLSIISEILDAAKIEEGKFKIKKEESDILDLAREQIEIFSYVAREKQIEIHLDAAHNIPKFLFDPGRIGQVINNLLSNSIKFTQKGGKIDFKIKQQNGQIWVEVIDNGPGIPNDKKSILFTKFGQINNESGGGAGSGLGLFIAKQIVQSHGGKIWVEAGQEGEKGTKVTFTLPLLFKQVGVPAQSLAVGQKLLN